MKKVISMFLTLSMLVASAGITVANAQTSSEADPNLIFDMKIVPEGDTYTVEDESGNTGYLADDYISHTPKRYGDTEYKPELGTVNGTNQNYLIFGVDGETDYEYTRRTLHVKFKDDKGIEFAEGDERTYEMWINFQKPKTSSTILSFGCDFSDYSTNSNHNFQCQANRVQTSVNDKTTWWVYPNRENYTNAAENLNIENNVWKHLVITEEFKETDAQTGSGTWTSKSYVDGKLVSTGTITDVPKSDFDDGDGTFTTDMGKGHKADTLSIGGSLWGKALNCSIGDFKVYNDVRTAEEINRDYENSLENYVETEPTIPPDDANLLFDMKIENDGDDYKVTDESGNTGYLAKDYITYTPARYGIEYKPGLGNGNGTNQNYLIFGVDGETDYEYTRRTLHVKFKDDKGIEFAEGDERSYEMWINFQKPQSSKTLFSFGCNYSDYSTNSNHNYLCATNRVQTSTNGNTTWWVYPSGDSYTNAANDLDIENNVWKHLVITEKFTITDTETNVGKWTAKSYIDGELVSTGTITNVPKSDFDVGDGTFTTSKGEGHKANTLSIGCSLGGSAFNCSIADFKLYKDVRTLAEIRNDYIVSSKGFGKYDALLSFRSVEINNNDYFEADTVRTPGTAKVRAVLESNDVVDRTYTLVAAVTGDRLYDVDVTRDISLNVGEKKYFECVLDIPDKTEGTYVKLMLFDSLTTLKPICEAVTKVVDTKQITMPNIFSNDMILQRGAQVNIFGTAPGGSIAVAEFGEYSAESAAANGEFVVKLPEMPAENEGKTLTVRVLDENRNELKVFTYENVVVGDVFYGAGQSNMSMKMSASDFGDLAERMTLVENARMFNVTQVNSVGARPSGDVEKWQIIDETNYTNGSATMYPTILKLRELNAIEPDVPIGFVKCAWGGTNVHHWVGTDLLEKWEDEGIYANPYTNYLKGTLHNGVRHTDLYYSMAQAVTPFTFKAAVWYQGEGETSYTTTYATLASDMIEMMRRDFGYEIPYFIVQLPGCLLWPGTWGSFRFAQLTIPEKTEGDSEYVVVISDTGEENNVHPGDKDIVGERIARRMMKELYGRDDIAWSGPEFESAVADGNEVTISFKQETINDGLCSLAEDESLEGFQVSSDGSSWKTADARIAGETIVVSSTEVSEPKYVRFGKVEGILKSAGSYKTEIYGGTEKTVMLPLVQFSEAISN